MSDPLVSNPGHGTPIGRTADGKEVFLSDPYQQLFDDLEEKLNQNLLETVLQLNVYTVSTLPTVPTSPKIGVIGVSDETGGPTMAFSNGTNWLRTLDNAIVS